MCSNKPCRSSNKSQRISISYAIAIVLAAFFFSNFADASASASLSADLTLPQPQLEVSSPKVVVGELVAITVSGAEETQVVISTEATIFRYLTSAQTILFRPAKPGAYEVFLVNATNASEVLASAAFEALPEPWRVLVEKTTYQPGELVRITTSHDVEGYTFEITLNNNTYYLLGSLSNGSVEFVPAQEGAYAVTAYYQNETFTANLTANFTVASARVISKLRYNSTGYVGDAINVTAENLAEYAVAVQTPSERFNYLGLNRALSFTPVEEGNYTIQLIKEGTAEDAVTVFVKASHQQRQPVLPVETFALPEDVRLLLNFTELAKTHASFFDRIFRKSPIAQVTAYVQGYETDTRFRLTLSPLEKDSFELRLYSNSRIEPGNYTIALQVQLHDLQLNQSYGFMWVEQPKQTVKPQPPAGDEANIFEYVDNSFSTNSSVIFMVNLTDKLPFPRSLLDVLLRRSRLDALVLYVEGQENNSIFSPKAERIADDDFLISIPWKGQVRPDIYKLVTIAVSKGSYHRTEKVFNWGLTNKSLIIEKANALRKAANDGTPYLPYIPQPGQQPQENNAGLAIKSDSLLSYAARFISYSANSTNASIGEMVVTFTASATQPLKSIVMHNFTPDVSFKEGALGIATGSVEAPKHAKPAKAYAIDPSFFISADDSGSQSSATLTAAAVAEKSGLYLCYDYNFTNSSCGSWRFNRNLSKGEEYEISFTAPIAVAETEVSGISVADATPTATAASATAAADEEGTQIFREQETRARQNTAYGVKILVVTAAGNITDALLTETIPQGWSFESLPENATLQGSTSFTLPVRPGQATTGLSLISYRAKSPASATAAAEAFTSAVTAMMNQSPAAKSAATEVLVDDENTPFEITATVYGNGKSQLQPGLATNLTYGLEFSITRMTGRNVPTHPVLFTWPYNSSQLALNGVGKGCENQKVSRHNDIKALQCTWKHFKEGETKRFTAAIMPVAEGIHSTAINVTYDPPRIKTAVVKEAPYKISFTAKAYNQGLLLELWHNANATLQISVSSEVKALLSRQAISQNEKASILVQDYESEYFTIAVGDEIISVGEFPIAIEKSPQKEKAETSAAETKAEKGQKEKTGIPGFAGKMASGVKNAVALAVKRVFGAVKSAFTPRITGFAAAGLKEREALPPQNQTRPAEPRPEQQSTRQNETGADKGADEGERQPQQKATGQQQPQPAAKEQPGQQPRQQQFFATEPGKGSGDTPRPTPAPKPEEPKPAPKARKEWFPTYKDLVLVLEDFTPQLNATAIISRKVECGRCDNYTVPENSEVNITVTAYNFKQNADRLTEYVPINWSITSAGGGSISSHNSTHNKIAWLPKAQYAATVSYSANSPSKEAPTYPFKAVLESNAELAEGESHPVLIEPFSVTVKDSANSSLNTTAKVTKVKEERAKEVVVDVEVKVDDKAKLTISFSNFTIQKGSNAAFAIEELDKQQAKEADAAFVKLYSIDAQSLNFSSAEVTAVATGSALQKCADWNFAQQRCNGSWAKLLDLFPGQAYTFTLTPGDPGYAETGLATINTNKSVYHPDEHARLTAVVLDTAGRLVEGAEVTINITSPSNEVETFTTANGTIIETERGIYEATYTSTQESGAYTLTVRAEGQGVNSTLNSYFTVQDFYEFDILRSSPVTTDPFTGPFTTTITAISYANETTQFSLTEALPRNFTVTEANGAAVSSAGNKTLLTWQMQNSTTVNYTARPPLSTPELWELQAFVTYAGGTKNFTEARPWLLAVDPAAPPQACEGQDDNAQNTFNDACDGTYPAACGAGGDLLSCNDGQSETHTTTNNNQWAGVRISAYNSSWTNCAAVTEVQVCYEWWTTANYDVWLVRVDNDNWASPANANASDPGTTANPGVKCTNVTSQDDWGCSNFDGTGTAAQAVVQAQTNSNNDRSITIDVLYLNVTMTTAVNIPPNATIILPAAKANISGSILVNASINDTTTPVTAVNLTLLNNTGIATALVPMSNGTGTAYSGYWNATFNTATLPDGYYNISVNATDSQGSWNITSNVSVVIDNTKPNASTGSPLNGSAVSGSFTINASINDSQSGVSNASFRLIKSKTTAASAWVPAALRTGTITQGFWNASYNATSLQNGKYNITLNATDFAGNTQLLNLSEINVNNPFEPPKANWTVQSGTLAVAAGSNYGDAAINWSEMSNTFVLFSSRFTSAEATPAESEFYTMLVNQTLVRFVRGGTASASVSIDYYVVSSSEIYVQNELVPYTASDNSLSAAIDDVVTGKTAVIAEAACDSTTQADWHETHWIANATGPRSVNLTRLGASACGGNISLFAVEFNDASTIQQGRSDAGDSLTVPITGIDPSHSFLLFERACANPNMDDCGVKGNITNSSALIFERASSGTGTNIVQWYVISNDNFDAQRGELGPETGATTTAALSPEVNTSSALSTTSAQNTGTGTRYSRLAWAGMITAADNLSIVRNDTTLNNYISWQAVNFAPPPQSDPELPVITLNSPPDAASISDDDISFNFSASDNIATTLNCSIKIDGSVNQTWASVGNGTSVNTTIWNFNSGAHQWNATCSDIVVNSNTSSTYTFTTTAGPDMPIKVFKVYDNIMSDTVLAGSGLGPLRSVFTLWNPNSYARNLTGLADNFSVVDNVVASFQNSSPNTGWAITGPSGTGGNVSWNGSVEVGALDAAAMYYGFFVTSEIGAGAASNNAPMTTTATDHENITNAIPHSNIDNPEDAVPWILTEVSTNNASYDYIANASATQSTTTYFRFGEFACTGIVDSGCQAVLTVNLEPGWDVTGCGEPGNNTVCSDTQVKWEGLPMNGFNDTTCGLPANYFGTQYSFTGVPPAYTGTNYTLLNATLHYCDNIGNQHDTVGEHPLKIIVDSSTPPAITFNEPKETVAVYNYSGITSPSGSHNASEGGTSSGIPPPPANAPLTGTEATTQSYVNLSTSNNTRYHTVITTSGQRVFQSFNFKVTESPSDISKLTLRHEGFATRRTSQTADPFLIYIYNYTSDSYIELKNVTASSTDTATVIELTKAFTDYITSSGVWALVEGNFIVGGGGAARADLHTDYIALEVTTLPALSGPQLINVTATDSEGVSSCAYRYENSTAIVTNFAGLDSTGSSHFSNTSDTSALQDATYTLRARCFDTGNNQNNITISVAVSNAIPAVYLQSPQNNTNFTTANNLTFVWNATDSRGGSLTCNLTIDSQTNSSGIVSDSNKNTSKAVNNFNDGYHYWGVACQNSGGVTAVNSSRNFTVDINAPSVSLGIPVNNNFSNSSAVTFTYTPSDGTAIASCSPIIDKTINMTNTTIINNALNNFTIAGFNSRNYSWSVNCTDQFDKTGASPARNFTVDTEKPSINLTAPPNGASLTNGTVQFNFTATDNIDTVMGCNLTVNSVILESNIAAANNTKQIRNQTLADGFKQWNATCWDDTGNTNTSATWNFTVSGPPSVVIYSPANNTHIRGNPYNISFVYTPSDGDGIANCSLVINSAVNQTNTTAVINSANNSINLTNASEQVANWTIMCFDGLGTQGNATARRLTIDNTPPYVNLTGPANNFTFSNGSVQLNFTSFDNYANNQTCNLAVNSIIEEQNFVVQNNTLSKRNITLGSGVKLWNATCVDFAGNSNTSQTYNFTVLGAPTVILQLPGNNTVQKGTNLNFSYYADDLDPIANCTLIINNVVNQTNTSRLAIPGTNSFLANLSQRSYNWTANCTDTFNNRGTADDPFIIAIDTTKPWFNLSAPANGTNVTNLSTPFTDHSTQFNFTAYDNYNTTMTCNLTIDSAVPSGHTNFNVINNTLNLRNQTGLKEGPHTWNASCFDNVSNFNTSQTYNFTLDFAPRVKLQSPDNNTYTNSTGTFVYNVTDYSQIANCSLLLNGGINSTNTSVTNNANNSFPLEGINEQRLEWAVQCYDGSNNRGNDTARVLYVDTTAPTVHAKQPNGTAFSSGSSIQFTINATDNNATGMPCSIYINSTAADNFTAAKNQDTARTLNIATTGYHIWNSTCADNATNTGTSATLNFTITTAPTVTLLAPANDSADLDGNVTFFYSATDTDLANCSLLINGVVNASNTSIVVSGDTSNFTTANFSQGAYNWTVNCLDTTDFAGNATPFVLYIDSFAPYLINLTSPANSSNVTSRNVTFNFTAFDAVDQLLSCNLTINSTINQTGINATNGTAKTVMVPNFNVGDYNWSVACQDNANLTNASSTFIFALNGNPSVSLQAPVHTANTSQRYTNFSYLPGSAFGMDNCQLFLDESNNMTDIAVRIGEVNSFNISYPLNEGIHNWSVMCEDIYFAQASDGPWNLTTDLNGPFVQPDSPDGTAHNYTTLSFNFTPSDNFGTFATCSLTVNGTTKSSGNYAKNATSANVTAGSYTDGLHIWNATCTDPAGNANTSNSLNFTITEPPSLTLGNPANLTRSNNSNQTFYFTPFDNSNQISSCTLLLNSILNGTNTSITTGAENFITMQNLSHSEYSWSVNCSDAAGNSRSNSTAKILRIDKLGPGIDQSRPTEGQVFNFDDITFNFTATDQFGLATQMSCGILLNGQLNTTVSPVTSGAVNLSLIENLNIGRHNWSVSCTDDLGNTNATSNVSFIVNAPDLTLNETHIVFNNTNPDEGQNITVNATILNVGGNPATNATVQFFDNNGTNENQFSIQNVTIEPGQNATVTANLTMTAAMHMVTVALDMDNLLVELDDTNNNASRNISILKATISSPPNSTVQSARNATVNSTVRNYRDADLNLTLFVDRKLNTTNLTRDGNYNLTVLNFTEGVHTVTAQASEPDPLNNNQTFRSKNSTAITITVDQTPPLANITTANNTFFANATPTVYFNVTDNFDAAINYTVFVNTTIEDYNYTNNGTLANVTLAARTNGSYLVTIEAFDDAGNRANGTPIVIFIDTALPSINISTANNTNFSDLTPEISFNATDNLDAVLNYTIFVDDRKDDNGTRPGGQNTANLTAQTEGEHNITIEALDEAGNRANSTPVRIFIDATAPTIAIENPTPNGLEGFTIGILTTISDGAGVGTANASFKITNDTSALLESGALAAPGYDTTWDSTLDIDNSTHTYYVNLTVSANDTLGNSRNVTVRFIVDNRNPDITFFVPSQNDFNSSFNLSITIENYNLTLSNYSIFNSTGQQQNNTNASIFSARFNWTDLVNLSNLTNYPEGLFNITAYATDTLGNNRTAGSFFRVDRTAPNLTLETPANNSNLTGAQLEFNFTAMDSFDTSMTCNLTIDSAIEKQNFAAANATLANATIDATFSDGPHFWQIQCMDNAGNRNTTTARNFTYDTAPPAITLNTPANSTANNTRNVSFTYTPADATTTTANCTLLINGTANKTATGIQNSQVNNFTVQNFNEGVYLWNAQCTDVVGNTNRSAYNYTLTLDFANPAAAITTANGTAFSAGRPNITISLTDNLDQVLNYTMFVNGEKDDNGTAQNGAGTNATLTFHSNGTYAVIAEAADDAGNRANSTPINITIDSVKPAINLSAPPNNSNITTIAVYFNFTASDNLANSFSCDLVIDNAANATTAVINATSQNLSVANFTAGIHAWNVSCTDNAGNQNASDTFYFNMTKPDLVITSANITFNASRFEENKAITITANVYNTGEAESQNALVEFFNGTPSEGRQLANATVSLLPGANATVNTTSAFAIGTFNISVRLDGPGRVDESNEANNLANKTLFISMWNLIFGNISGEYQLRNDTLSILYEWIATENSAGNVYIADYDSVVSWSNLTKLGMNKSDAEGGNFTLTDFEELDTAMNTTGYEDSVNRTYTSEGRQRMNGTFSAFAKTFTNVPIANSTNNSNFTTGILWDAADDQDGEYNGTADVVFITNMSGATWGAYGVYDYEIRVPALLRNYKGPDRLTVVFYLELR